MNKIPYYLSILFFSVVILLLAMQWGLASPVPDLKTWGILSSRQLANAQTVDAASPLRALLPKSGKISMIMDRPYQVGQKLEETLYRTQNYLSPLLLNPKPIEEIAFVLCTSEKNAHQRLKETGYEWIENLHFGQGVAKLIK